MTTPKTTAAGSTIRWARVNNEPFEYAIQQGPHGDEFVKLLDGSCLHRPAQCEVQTDGDVRALEDMTLASNARKAAIEECARVAENWFGNTVGKVSFGPSAQDAIAAGIRSLSLSSADREAAAEMHASGRTKAGNDIGGI